MRLAHISDLHLSKISLHLPDLFSKRILGTANLLLKRKRAFQQQTLDTLLPIFDSRKIDALLITGDLSSTSLKEEFLLVHGFLQKIQERKIRIFLLPGNHDMYTKKAFENKTFYQCFQSFCDFSTLPKEGISHSSLDEKWQLVLVDCAKSTSLFSSRGLFSKEIEERLIPLLDSLRHHFVLIALHFPFSDQISSRKMLERKEALVKILHQYPNVKICLHGHTHQSSLEDLRYQHLPITIGAGSVTWKKNATFNLLETMPNSCMVSTFQWQPNGWNLKKTNSFLF